MEAQEAQKPQEAGTHIVLPENSFTAFRFLYGEVEEITQVSGCVLLGSIPPLWIKEHQNSLLRTLSRSSYAGVVDNLKKMVLPKGAKSLPTEYRLERTRKLFESILHHQNELAGEVSGRDDDYDDDYEDGVDNGVDDSVDDGVPHGTSKHTVPAITVQNADVADSFVTALEESSLLEPFRSVLKPDNPIEPISKPSILKNSSFNFNPSVSKVSTVSILDESLSTGSAQTKLNASNIASKSNGKVKFTRFKTADSSTRSRIVNLRPAPENDTDNVSLLMPLDKSHRDSLKKIKRIASMTKNKLTNETVKNQRRIFEKIRTTYSIGEIIKMEKMLVMVKAIQLNSTFSEFKELEPCDTRVLERWKEYIVVARSTNEVDNPILLQLYTNREIPNETNSKHSESEYDFTLNKNSLINLYNVLDKSISIVNQNKVYLFKCQTPSSSIGWFSFFNQSLGKIKSSNNFKLQIPQIDMAIDLKLSLEIFKLIDQPIVETHLTQEQIGYSTDSRPIIKYLLNKLSKKLEETGYSKMADKLKANRYALVLCWRYYDRLEWLFGKSLQHIFWQQAMNTTHALELRTIQHYPSQVKGLKEPLPIEGFLSRLTSKTGSLKKGLFNTQIFKYSYLYTSNNLLFFTHSFKALPPIPYDETLEVTSDPTILNLEKYYKNVKNAQIPPVSEHNPYPVDSSHHITWLKENLSEEELIKRDRFAIFQFERKVALLIRSEGVLDLTEIKEIVEYNPEKIPLAVEITNAIQWNNKVDTKSLLKTKELAKSRKDCYFKIILKNGVFWILRAPTSEIRNEWISRLVELKEYWIKRINEDLLKLKTIKLANMKSLHIDEYFDSNSSASTLNRWESLHALADPEIHNISSSSMFRPIIKSGYIFQKPKKHSSFRKLFIVLIPGYLKIYKVFHKNLNGIANSTIYHPHYMTIPISESYVYSGNICELDLIDQRSSNELDIGNDPERHSLPRIYDDGWLSSDDEVSRCFTLWFGKKRVIAGVKHHHHDLSNNQESIQESIQKNPGLIRMVSRLGVTGKSMVFMCRSRQEKELWVSNLNIMLERFGSFSTE